MATAKWVDEAELDFSLSDLQNKAYDALTLNAETDDSTDEAICNALSEAGLRKMHGMEYRYDSTATREQYYQAVLHGMRDWSGK